MEIVRALGTCPTEIEQDLLPFPIDRQGQLELGTVIERNLKGPVLKAADQPLNGSRRMVLNVLEIAPNTLAALKLQKLIEQFSPQMIGGCLGLKICPEQFGVSGR